MDGTTSPKHEQVHHSLEVKLAAPDDAELICSIRYKAWIDTYPNEELGITAEDIKINAQGLHGEFIPRRIAWLEEKLAGTNQNWIAYVGQIDNVTRGFVIASRDDKARKFINSIYVEPGFQGKGLGKQLMQRALDWLGDGEDVYLEVASYNNDAISFYERFGFAKTTNKVAEEPDRPSYIKPIPQTEMVLRAKSD